MDEAHDIAASQIRQAVVSAGDTSTDIEAHIPPRDLSWFKTEPLDDNGVFRGIEMIVDGFLASGHNAISGKRGVGKTSTLVPLLLAIAGLYPDYTLNVPVRRVVYLMTEDYRQVRQMILGMKREGIISAPWSEINHWLRMSHSERMDSAEIIEHGPELEKCFTTFTRPNGEPIKCYPLVVLDTVLANIRSENSNSNDEVANDVTAIRQAFKMINLLLVGHTPKNSNGGESTMLGAQAWEGLVQGAMTIERSGNAPNYRSEIKLTKPRFEPLHWKFALDSRVLEIHGAEDFWGNKTVERIRYNLILDPATSPPARDGEPAQQSLKKELLSFIYSHPGCSFNDIKKGITGDGCGESKKKAALDAMEKEDLITIDRAGNGHTHTIKSEMPVELLNLSETSASSKATEEVA